MPNPSIDETISPQVSDSNPNTPNVTHFLRRGAQEGWTLLDDDATAEALQRLDGLANRSVKSRFSMSGPSSSSRVSSRPGTPASKSNTASPQWEGITFESAQVQARKRRGSSDGKDSAPPSAPESTSKRSHHAPARRSSVAHKQERRNSFSDHEDNQLRVKEVDRSGTAQSGDQPVVPQTDVPPLPPLPRQVSLRKRAKSPSSPLSKSRESLVANAADIATNSVSAERCPQNTGSKREPSVQDTSKRKASTLAPKTPSKKWSFSSALSLRISNSPSTIAREMNRQSYAAPLRVSSSGGPFSRTSREEVVSPMSSMLSPSLPPTLNPESRDRNVDVFNAGDFLRASTGSGSTSPSPQTKDPLNHRRLTPSAIPFFRRSSSQSIHAPSINTSSSPPPVVLSSPSGLPTQTEEATSTPGNRKSSVLNLLRGSSSRKSMLLEKNKDESSKRRNAEQRASDDSSQNTIGLSNLTREEKSGRREVKERSESRISVLMGRRRGKVSTIITKRIIIQYIRPYPPQRSRKSKPRRSYRLCKCRLFLARQLRS